MNENRIKKPTAAENLMELMSFTADKVVELADANSVLGERIEIDGMTIIPVSKISAGFVGGGANVINAGAKKSNTPAGSGASVKVTPLSFLVVSGGEVRIVAIDATTKDSKQGIIGKVLEAVKSLKKKKDDKKDDKKEEPAQA